MTQETPSFAEVFEAVTAEGGVTPALVRRVFDAILVGAWTPVQVAGLLVALRLHGETAEMIAAAAESMRQAMIPVQHGFQRLLDTCGTGGDGSGTLNLSTAAAVVVASAGVPVAKHGNRAISSRSGSADVLEALGIPVALPAQAARSILESANICFLMAPTHHPAMKHAVQARRELGIRSIFNCLGPLSNPARATHQLIGAYDDSLRRVFAESLRALGSQRAWIVRGLDGLDEVSPQGETRVTELDGQTLREFEIVPEDFGIERSPLSAIAGGDAAHNARALEQVFANQAHPARSAIVLNAAAALVVFDRSAPREAAQRAEEAIASGAAARTLDSWRNAARRAADTSAS